MFTNLNKFKFSQESHSHENEDAPDKPPTAFIATIVIFSFIFVLVCVAIAFPVTEKLVEAQENKINSGMGNTERLNYISDQKEIMSTYKKKDETHYQIPIQQAMKMVEMKQGDMSKMMDNDDKKSTNGSDK